LLMRSFMAEKTGVSIHYTREGGSSRNRGKIPTAGIGA